MYLSAHLARAPAPARGCFVDGDGSFGRVFESRRGGTEAQTARRAVCRARWPEPNAEQASTSGTNPPDLSWGSWGKRAGVNRAAERYSGSSELDARPSVPPGAAVLPSTTHETNGRSANGSGSRGSNGASARGRSSNRTPSARWRARIQVQPPLDANAGPADMNTWTQGSLMRSQPKLAGANAQQMEPFSRRGAVQWFDSDPTAPSLVPAQRVAGESTADEDSAGAPDAACDDDLSQPHLEDDGLQLESADLAPEDDLVSQRLQAAEDLSALRQVLDTSGVELSASHVAQTMLCMGRMGRLLNEEQLRLVHEDPLMAALVEVVDRKISQFTPKRLCMTLWGMAALRFTPGAVMSKVVRAVEAQLDDLEPRQVASVMWAFGRLELHPGAALVDAVVKRALLMLVDMQPQGLCNLVWAFARLRERRTDLLDAVAVEAEQRIQACSTQGLSNLAWAYAKLHHAPPCGLFDAIEEQAKQRFAELSSQSVANILWASAVQGRKPAALLLRASSEIKACGLQFAPYDLVHILVALAMTGHRHDEKLISSVLAQCTRNLAAYPPGLLCGMLWALAELKSRCGRSFAEQVLPLLQPAVAKMSHNQVANLTFSLGGLMVDVPYEMTGALVYRLKETVPLMTAKQLCGTSHGMSRAPGFKGWQRVYVNNFIVEAMTSRIQAGQARPQEILNVLADQRRLQRHPIGFIHLCLDAMTEAIARRECNMIDLAQTALVFGKWRWGRPGNPHPPRVERMQRLYSELQAAAVPFLAEGKVSQRQLANMVWGHGRVFVRFTNQEFMHGVSNMLITQAKTFKPVDVANVMTGLVGMDLSPGLLALDELADNVNDRYSEYSPFELAQALYGFSRFNYHPGAVVGRIKVMFRKQPELFDKHSTWNLDYAFNVLEGANDKRRMLGAAEQSVDDRLTDGDVAALIERNRARVLASQDVSDEYESEESEDGSDVDYDDGILEYDEDAEEIVVPAAKVNKYRIPLRLRTARS